MNDITPVAVMIKGPSFIFVKQDSPFKTWDDFAKEAKANPNKLKVATLGFGSVDDFSLTVLDRGGVKVVQVPFKVFRGMASLQAIVDRLDVEDSESADVEALGAEGMEISVPARGCGLPRS